MQLMFIKEKRTQRHHWRRGVARVSNLTMDRPVDRELIYFQEIYAVRFAPALRALRVIHILFFGLEFSGLGLQFCQVSFLTMHLHLFVYRSRYRCRENCPIMGNIYNCIYSMGRRQNKTKFKENLYFFIFCIERVEFGNNSLIFFFVKHEKRDAS